VVRVVCRSGRVFINLRRGFGWGVILLSRWGSEVLSREGMFHEYQNLEA
jgi:hypothetical protein